LLECRVPVDDPAVLKAAGYVRNNVGHLKDARHETYQLSLAILFLDRLGDPKDRVLIQGMALRLLAGQNDAGGWTYRSHHLLTPHEMQQLLVFLKSHRPEGARPKAINQQADPGKQVAKSDKLPKQMVSSDDPFQQLADLLK